MQIRSKRLASVALAVSLSTGTASALAQAMVGGASMPPTKDIVLLAK